MLVMVDESQQKKKIDYKRQVAYKTRIIDITEGKYVRSESQPNYIVTDNGREISRVNIIGTAISKDIELNHESIILDDGTSSIMVRSFEKDDSIAKTQIGEVVLIIGRPREFNEDKYIIPEIIKKIDNAKWIELRRLEMLKEFGEFKKKAPEKVIKEESDGKEIPSQKIYNLIKSLDKGDGADMEELINQSGLDNAEDVVSNLIREGEVFQNRPGKLKIL